MTIIDERALSILTATPATMSALLAGVGDASAASDTWGPLEIVAHLVDAEGIAFVERIERIIGEDQPYIRSINPAARLEAGGYLKRPLASLLTELQQARAVHVPWLRALDATTLTRTGEHHHAQTISGADIVHQWAFHDLQHLRQLAEALQVPLIDHMGNTRKFYDV